MRTRVYLSIVMVTALGGCGGVQPESPPATAQAKAFPMANEWPFKDAENCAVITLARILDGSKPILYVVHDEDGGWQFLDGGDVSEDDAKTVSLKQVVLLDLSLKSLADLPTGWTAERNSPDQPWKRSQR